MFKKIALLLPVLFIAFALFACKKGPQQVNLTGTVEVVSTHPSPMSLPENLRTAYITACVIQADGKRVLLSVGGADRNTLTSSDGKTVTLAGAFTKKTVYKGSEVDLFSVDKIVELK